eukprot:TRINITY_DN6860_c0_g1_i1.p1 TRINITY_DN6860_c0_g1~~TRINITY_DN6860_c0_g1_i1.p1  ORF type:complete len:147 (-),score=21.17 TRINITY_DN6860_c0_g1_i1:139-528(-)
MAEPPATPPKPEPDEAERIAHSPPRQGGAREWEVSIVSRIEEALRRQHETITRLLEATLEARGAKFEAMQRQHDENIKILVAILEAQREKFEALLRRQQEENANLLAAAFGDRHVPGNDAQPRQQPPPQ